VTTIIFCSWLATGLLPDAFMLIGAQTAKAGRISRQPRPTQDEKEG